MVIDATTDLPSQEASQAAEMNQFWHLKMILDPN